MTHRESDKRMTKEREAEIRDGDEVKTKKPNRGKRARDPWFIILELLKDMTVEERTRCLRATAAFFKVKL